jgi:hypothetical protein
LFCCDCPVARATEIANKMNGSAALRHLCIAH